MWYPNRDRRARTRRVATSLVNSVLRCSWYLVTRCLSEIRAAHERRGATAARLWRSHAAVRDAPRVASRRVSSRLRRHIMPACARRCRGANDLGSTRLDSTWVARRRRARRTAPPTAITLTYVRGPLGIATYCQYSDIDIIRDGAGAVTEIARRRRDRVFHDYVKRTSLSVPETMMLNLFDRILGWFLPKKISIPNILGIEPLWNLNFEKIFNYKSVRKILHFQSLVIETFLIYLWHLRKKNNRLLFDQNVDSIYFIREFTGDNKYLSSASPLWKIEDCAFSGCWKL